MTDSLWKSHTVYQLNGHQGFIQLPAEQQRLNDSPEFQKRPWGFFGPAIVLAYMADRPKGPRLIVRIVTATDPTSPSHVPPLYMFSDDYGDTWFGKLMPTDTHAEPIGDGTGLSYAGNGKLFVRPLAYNPKSIVHGNCYGEKWEQVPLDDPNTWTIAFDSNGHTDDDYFPMLVEQNDGGFRLSLSWAYESPIRGPRKLWRSLDGGKTWASTFVPQWDLFSEIAISKTILGGYVAAGRYWDPPDPNNQDDSYCGLGVSIDPRAVDEWSPAKKLYHYGRHHPSMVNLPNGDIVMSYIVRKGYLPDGNIPRYGIEAIVSHDQGETWDFDHRYFLATWQAPIVPNNTHPDNDWSCQCTSLV